MNWRKFSYSLAPNCATADFIVDVSVYGNRVYYLAERARNFEITISWEDDCNDRHHDSPIT